MRRLRHVKTHMNAGIDLHVCMRYVYTYVNMHMNTYSLRYIRAYEWTHAMLMHIPTFTYTHVSRCICWHHKYDRCVHRHTYENFHVFPYMYMLCQYVHAYVNMYTHVHMHIFVHIHDLKWSKQSIDLCSNNILIPSAIFTFDHLGNRTLVFHHTHFNFLFYLAEP